MSGISITYLEYWYPPSPDNYPHNKAQNLHSEPIHLEWSIQATLPSNNSILMEYGSSSLKKTRAKQWKKRETKPIPPLKIIEIRSSNKKTKNSLSVSPFSIRSGFDRVPTSCEPLFGSATQITKVCYTLPTQNSTYQPYSRKKMIKISDHGEDHTPWAIWEHYWGILNHFWKTCKTPR